MNASPQDKKFQHLIEWIDGDNAAAFVKPAICDLNGVLRGKRLPVAKAKKILNGDLKLPLATLFVDIWGRDVIGSGKVLETGDNDGVLFPTGRDFLPVNWTDQQSALLPVWMFCADESPYQADPRQALAAIVDRFRIKGLTPVCATELEFYVFDPVVNGDGIAPPMTPDGRRRLTTNSLYAVDDLDNFEAFLNDVYVACERMNVPAEAAISENGSGQFEINLSHLPDALRVADDAVLFKYIVKAVARKHGLSATFMAKPYGGDSGNGFHTHFSILDESGENIFANGAPEGSDMLHWAVGGLLSALPDTMLVFAPHANSYRRLREGSHAPVNIAWGYDNRTSAVRIPSGPDQSRRIEHRVAGADANPYLVLAAILGTALNGIEQKITPEEPIQGNAYASDHRRLPATWHDAITKFEASNIAREMFSNLLVDVFSACKRQELDTFAEIVPSAEHKAYLETV